MRSPACRVAGGQYVDARGRALAAMGKQGVAPNQEVLGPLPIQ